MQREYSGSKRSKMVVLRRVYISLSCGNVLLCHGKPSGSGRESGVELFLTATATERAPSIYVPVSDSFLTTRFESMLRRIALFSVMKKPEISDIMKTVTFFE